MLIVDGASRIVLHPNIRIDVPRSADIAVIFLQSPIFFTNLISPICLWTQGSELRQIVGKFGYSVGWGINEAGALSEFKKHVALRVDRESCTKYYFEYLQSEKYFCALSSVGSTPCELDDPFYMKIDEKWFLRGLLNFYYFKADENKCSTSLPVLYEDVAKYSKWIQLMKV